MSVLYFSTRKVEMSLRNAEFLRGSRVENRERFGAKVTSLPPFLSYVEACIWKARDEQEVRRVVDHSHAMDPSFFGWETYRKGPNPVGCFGTGYESFFVGRVASQDEVQSYLLRMGKEIWDGIRRKHRNSYQSRNTLEKVIRGESHAMFGVEEWMSIFAGSLARQRAEIATNRAAQEYRSQTKAKVSTLPKINYVLGADGQIHQEYYIPVAPVAASGLESVALSDEEELALITMKNIGKFGHPLIRSAAEYSHL